MDLTLVLYDISFAVVCYAMYKSYMYKIKKEKENAKKDLTK